MNYNSIIMEYQKIINLLENISNQPSKFRTKNWVEVNDESHGTYNVDNQIKFKTSILRSSLCDYSDAYILVSAAITVPRTAAAANNRRNIIMKNRAPFTNCISEINNTQIHNSKHIDIVMPMYNLIEYSHSYSKTSGSLWHHCRDEPFLNDNGATADFPADNNNSGSFEFKTKILCGTENDGTKNVRVPLKYWSNFWRTLAIPLINCEINLSLTCCNSCFIIDNPIVKYTNLFALSFENTDGRSYMIHDTVTRDIIFHL